MPSLERKLTKNAPCLNQSAISNFALYVIKQFIDSKMSDDQYLSPTQDNAIRVILPFKDQESANIVKFSSKIQTTLRPVFVSRKLNQDLQVREA